MCCLFGLIDYKNCLTIRKKEKIIRVLSAECEERGIDAAGIAYVEKGGIKIYKKPLPAHKIKFKFRSNPKIIMGHTRMTTQGDEKFNYNNHPFYSEKLNFALAHNGMIHNDKDLRKSENLPKTKIETDSFIAVQLIEKEGTLNFDSLKFMAEKVMGSFCFTVLNNQNELFIVKGNNPMAVYDFGGFYIYASTEDILDRILRKLRIKMPYNEIKIKCGDMIKIDERGEIEKENFDTSMIKMYDFGYFSGYGYGFNYLENTINDIDEYLEDIINYSKMVGVSEEDIFELIDMGFDLFDIEDILYEPELLNWYFEKAYEKI